MGQYEQDNDSHCKRTHAAVDTRGVPSLFLSPSPERRRKKIKGKKGEGRIIPVLLVHFLHSETEPLLCSGEGRIKDRYAAVPSLDHRCGFFSLLRDPF